jgi:hypothetical protein
VKFNFDATPAGSRMTIVTRFHIYAAKQHLASVLGFV